MRIAFLVHRFPAISETFILRQIAGLLDLGHEIDIYSERSPNADEPVHPEFERYAFLAPTDPFTTPFAYFGPCQHFFGASPRLRHSRSRFFNRVFIRSKRAH